MKMTICDRCGKQRIPNFEKWTLGELLQATVDRLAKAIKVKREPLRLMRGEYELDLCDKCRKDLSRWLSKPLKPEEITEEEQPDGYAEGKEGALSCVGCKYGDNGIFEVCENCVRGKIDQFEKEEKP